MLNLFLTLEFYKPFHFFGRLFCFVSVSKWNIHHLLMRFSSEHIKSGFPGQLILFLKLHFLLENTVKYKYRVPLMQSSVFHFISSLTATHFLIKTKSELYLERVYKNLVKIFGQPITFKCPVTCRLNDSCYPQISPCVDQDTHLLKPSFQISLDSLVQLRMFLYDTPECFWPYIILLPPLRDDMLL